MAKTTKRVSGAGKRSVLSRFSITAGIDTDINYLVTGIFNVDHDNIQVLEFEQNQTGYKSLSAWLSSNQVQYVIIESTGNYHLPAYDYLSSCGLNIQVINPVIVKSLLRVEGKSDKGDAATLARLAASFDLKTSNIPRDIERELRAHTRSIEALKNRRTQLSNKLQSGLYGWGVTVFRTIKFDSVSGRLLIEGLIDGLSPAENVKQGWKGSKLKAPTIEASLVQLKPWQQQFLASDFSEWQAAGRELEAAETRLIALVKDLGLEPLIALMATVPAVSPMLATIILAETGVNYWERYNSASAFARAIGVVPGNQVSGGKIVKRKTVHGNEHVKFQLLNAVKGWNLHASKQHELKMFLENYRKRGSWSKAISAVARQIAESLYHIGRTQTPYMTKSQHKAFRKTLLSDVVKGS